MTGKLYELTDNQWDQVKHDFEISNKNGRPYKIILIGGQVHDIKIATKLIINFKANM